MDYIDGKAKKNNQKLYHLFIMTTRFLQFEYPPQLYRSEIERHSVNVNEYHQEIVATMLHSIKNNRPNLELYQQQPYLTFAIRGKLIDFLLKMSIRLKILPFVFFRAVKIFDRYCSKRVVLLDQSQLIITTCLWIALKVQGGNNHFVNLSNVGKLSDVKTITDLGYGSGGRLLGPTERFRLPKLHELVKLCGAKCKYDQGMFKQMEIHVLSTLEWSLNDPSIEEFLTNSSEFNITPLLEDSTIAREIFKTKEYLSYVALYCNELIDVDVIELSEAICSITNEALNIRKNDCYYQKVNFVPSNDSDDEFFYESTTTTTTTPSNSRHLSMRVIKQHLISSVKNSSDFILKLFESAGPQQVYNSVMFNNNNNNSINTHISSYHALSPRQPPRKRNVTNSPNNNIHKKTPIGKYSCIPPPHQLPHNFTAFNDKMYSPVVLPSVLLKYNHSHGDSVSGASSTISTSSNFDDGSDSLTPTATKLPHIITAITHNNNSQASLHSQCSSRNDGLIFDHESGQHPVCSAGTPSSEADSPLLHLMKLD